MFSLLCPSIVTKLPTREDEMASGPDGATESLAQARRSAQGQPIGVSSNGMVESGPHATGSLQQTTALSSQRALEFHPLVLSDNQQLDPELLEGTLQLIA